MSSGTKERLPMSDYLREIVEEMHHNGRAVNESSHVDAECWKCRLSAALAAVEREGAREAAQGIEGTAEDKAELYWNVRKTPEMPLLEWVNERIENCKRIAAIKGDEDRERWLEDAWYFEQIRAALERTAQSPVAPAEDQ